MERDYSVELLRIIGACLVIGTHVKQGYFNGDALSRSRVYMACLTGDGVAVFWMILGFFYYDGPAEGFSYSAYLKKIWRRAVLPMLFFIFFIFWFSGFLLDGKTLLQSVSHTAEEYRELIDGMLHMKTVVPYTGHMWYLFTYTLAGLCFPALWGCVRLMKCRLKRWYCVPAVFLGVLIWNDVLKNTVFRFSHYSINALCGACIFILCGYVLYQHRDSFRNRRALGAAGVLGFFLCNAVRCYFVCQALAADKTDTLLLFWFTGFSLINVCCLCIMVWGLCGIWDRKPGVNRLIRHLGKKTFLIYIVHYIVLQKSRNMKLPSLLRSFTGTTALGTAIYELIYMAGVFVLSLLVAEGMSLVTGGLGKIKKKRKS